MGFVHLPVTLTDNHPQGDSVGITEGLLHQVLGRMAGIEIHVVVWDESELVALVKRDMTGGDAKEAITDLPEVTPSTSLGNEETAFDWEVGSRHKRKRPGLTHPGSV